MYSERYGCYNNATERDRLLGNPDKHGPQRARNLRAMPGVIASTIYVIISLHGRRQSRHLPLTSFSSAGDGRDNYNSHVIRAS